MKYKYQFRNQLILQLILISIPVFPSMQTIISHRTRIIINKLAVDNVRSDEITRRPELRRLTVSIEIDNWMRMLNQL